MNQEKNRITPSTLYLVATPIGNLSDISERAQKVLREVDFIAAEDTRNSLKLLSCYGIQKELVSYHEHNKRASGERIVARLLAGECCALITDAGMPAISDPGEDIVVLCAESGIRVSVVPGACAAVSALSVSGLPTRRFAFEGFLSANRTERKRHLEAIRREDRTLIFYEAPHKLKATLADMCDVLGASRRVCLARELTKLNEELQRTTLAEATEYYRDHEPRGEYVLIVEGASDTDVSEDNGNNHRPLSEHLAFYEAKGLSHMDAIKAVAKDRGVPKSEIYKQVCELKEQD